MLVAQGVCPCEVSGSKLTFCSKQLEIDKTAASGHLTADCVLQRSLREGEQMN